MKKLMMILSLILFLSGCSVKESKTKFQIVVTLFPQYDLIKRIVEDKAEVILLLPPGVEAHSYEPTPKDIVKINESDMFIYTSDNLETYASKIVKSIDNKDLEVIELIDEINIVDYHDHSEEEADHEEHDHEHDPHFWLDPALMADMSDLLLKYLIDFDPSNREFYTDNANREKSSYLALDKRFTELFSEAKSNEIIFAGHFAFGYFADKYGLEYLSPFENLNENAEPSIKKIKSLVDYINDNDIKVIYFEELVDPKLAKMLSNETGVKTLMLHAAHNVSKDELKNNISYVEIMERNYENLKVGLFDE